MEDSTNIDESINMEESINMDKQIIKEDIHQIDKNSKKKEYYELGEKVLAPVPTISAGADIAAKNKEIPVAGTSFKNAV
ncbi:unnamed protein product [Parnassius apollo]|uniref:(apollo) hypothetical protein n=1 Tax=Parnassius apollo TaxID=110799 RepID=A0A8S3Y2M8_PARAO|nr:unnamed protein product [Parnassius apollo]